MTSPALNRPVDVLQALDKDRRLIEAAARIAYASGADGEPLDRTLEQHDLARCAVANLIEATRGLIDFAEPILVAHGFGYMGRIEKARKALAAMGGDA